MIVTRTTYVYFLNSNLKKYSCSMFYATCIYLQGPSGWSKLYVLIAAYMLVAVIAFTIFGQVISAAFYVTFFGVLYHILIA